MADVVYFYMDPASPQCYRAKQYLIEKGIPFMELNLAEDPAARETYKELGSPPLPVFDVGGKLVCGLDYERLDEAWVSFAQEKGYPIETQLAKELVTREGLSDVIALPHLGPATIEYVAIAAVLAVVTLIEVGIFYLESLGSALTPILLSLSSLKFVLVVSFYMHLKYDSRLFLTIFSTALLIAVTLAVAGMALFRALA